MKKSVYTGVKGSKKGVKGGVYRECLKRGGAPGTRHPFTKKADSGNSGIYVLGIDPGLKGAFVVTNGDNDLRIYPMPLNPGDDLISFKGVVAVLADIQKRHSKLPVFLEKPVSFGMGTKGAFSYGRGYECLLIALDEYLFPYELVEPKRWTKAMHKGLEEDLKPKPKSLLAVQKFFPKLVGWLPKNKKGKFLDGPVDALLIAGYGLRKIREDEEGNFY